MNSYPDLGRQRQNTVLFQLTFGSQMSHLLTLKDADW